MIQVELTGTEQVQAHLRRIPPRLTATLQQGMTALLIYLQGYVRSRKLSGNPLKPRSGNLARSINWDPPQVLPTGGVVGHLYSQREVAAYAKVHEYGGAYMIRQHLRRVTKVFGNELASPVVATVRAHIAHYPERSFLRSSLRENQDRFRGMVLVAINRARAA